MKVLLEFRKGEAMNFMEACAVICKTGGTFHRVGDSNTIYKFDNKTLMQIRYTTGDVVILTITECLFTEDCFEIRPEKTYRWDWAILQIMAGKKVRKASFDKGAFIHYNKEEKCVTWQNHKELVMHAEILCATNWVLYNE
jgi:hypothetical protein